MTASFDIKNSNKEKLHQQKITNTELLVLCSTCCARFVAFMSNRCTGRIKFDMLTEVLEKNADFMTIRRIAIEVCIDAI